jgi:thiamine-monophosphate kinase
MMVEHIHFDLAYMPLKHLGYKAVVAAISDICAMNGVATHVSMSTSFSNRFSLEALEELYSGVRAACENYKIDFIGGDLTNSPKGLTLSAGGSGVADEDQIVWRKGASEGDLLVVTGDLGAAYLGLQLLEREKRIFLERPDFQPDLEGNDYILQRQLRPEARTDLKPLLAGHSVLPGSMILVKNGLNEAVQRLCNKSGTGAVIYEHTIPIDPQTYQRAIDFGIDPTVCCLDGGEDFEILFSVKKEDYEALKSSPDVTVIGHCTAASEGINLVSKSNVVHPLKPLNQG